MAKLTKLQIFEDSNSNTTQESSGYGLPGNDTQAFQFRLSVSTELVLPIPLWAKFARFKYGDDILTGARSNVWVRQGSVAVTSQTGAPVGQASELRPDLTPVIPGDDLRFICVTQAQVNVIFYPDPTKNHRL